MSEKIAAEKSVEVAEWPSLTDSAAADSAAVDVAAVFLSP